MVARVEPRVGDHLATPTQNLWLRHLHQEQGGQRFADAADAEQEVASAAQRGVLVDRLTNSPVDRLKLVREMLDRHGRQPGRGAIAKTTGEAILPLRPATNDTSPDGMQFAKSSHRRRWWRPW